MEEEMIKPFFVRENCHYDPAKDISPVQQGEVFDLASAFVNGMIPEDVQVPDVEYDNNVDPRSILGRPANEFEAIHMLETLKGLQSKKDSSSGIAEDVASS